MMSKVQHSCRLRHRYREDLGTRLSCFGCENKNSRTFFRTFYSSHDDLSSKNIARRQLDGQNLLFGVYLQTWTALSLLNSPYRGELDIEEGKHVFEWIIKQLMNSAFVGYEELGSLLINYSYSLIAKNNDELIHKKQ